MNEIDIFYYVGIIYLVILIGSLIDWRKGYVGYFDDMGKMREKFSFILNTIDKSKTMDLGELSDSRDKLKDILSDNKDELVKISNPSSLPGFLSVTFYIWQFVGIIFSDLWYLFLANLLILVISVFYPMLSKTILQSNKYQQIFLSDLIIRITIISVILYIHFKPF